MSESSEKNKNEEEDDEEEEEEEIIVYANFEDGSVDKDILQQDIQFKVIGLDSDTPIVQLGDTTFKGTWNEIIGTKVFFEEDPSPEPVDPVFTVMPEQMFKLKCMTTKTLDLSRIFLKPKAEEFTQNNENLPNLNGYNSDMEEQDILDLANVTIQPDLNTDVIMRDIAEESLIDNA